MATIQSVEALEILDSRGNPTLQVTVKLDDGAIGKAAVPAGASTGENEAVELRDQDKKRFFGKGVSKAAGYVRTPLGELLKGRDAYDQLRIDQAIIKADGTANKSLLGANTLLGVSLATARAAAASLRLPLYTYLGGAGASLLPCPMFNIINGGAHADNMLDFQEFMIRPIGAPTFSEAIRWGVEIVQTLKKMLQEKNQITSVGDEGGFAPRLASNEEVLDFIVQAIEKAGYRPSEQVSIALDPAASEFYDTSSRKYVEKKKKTAKEEALERTSDEMIAYFEALCGRYPITSIEDPLAQNDWAGWQQMTARLGNKIQIVGDDLLVTNTKFLRKGIEEKAANAILIKLNQIGTLSETLQCIALAKRHGFATIISHRSGETEDTFIADLAVGLGCGQIKTGSLARSDRTAKYNRLLEIEQELGPVGIFANSSFF